MGSRIAYCRGPYCVYADDAVRLLKEGGLKARAGSTSAYPSGVAPDSRSRREEGEHVETAEADGVDGEEVAGGVEVLPE